MKPQSPQLRLSRRTMLGTTAAGIMRICAENPASAQVSAAPEGTVRDRLWVFACPANSDWSYFKRRSVIPAPEGFSKTQTSKMRFQECAAAARRRILSS